MRGVPRSGLTGTGRTGMSPGTRGLPGLGCHGIPSEQIRNGPRLSGGLVDHPDPPIVLKDQREDKVITTRKMILNHSLRTTWHSSINSNLAQLNSSSLHGEHDLKISVSEILEEELMYMLVKLPASPSHYLAHTSHLHPIPWH